MTNSIKKTKPNDVHIITHQDLPLSCPLPKHAVWNAHPRVYLPIEKTGTARCPYCSAEYRLDDEQLESN